MKTIQPLVNRFNKWFNHYSKNQQKRLLLLFCAIAAGTVFIPLVWPPALSTVAQADYRTRHIGRPSGTITIDSLTQHHKSYGKANAARPTAGTY